jgi:pimeloyl-ACP methyl ester carboxylesterase
MTMVVTPEAELHYESFGRGADVVFIHGLGANMAFWYWPARAMVANNRRAILYDLRGHGQSSVPDKGYGLHQMQEDLLHLLDCLNVEQADVVGHSYGARVALAFAGLHPERVRTLTVADTQIRALQPLVRLREWPHWERWKQDLVANGMQDLPDADAVIDFQLLSKFNKYTSAQLNQSRRLAPARVSLRSRDMGIKGAKRWQLLLEKTTASRELNDEGPLTKTFFNTIRAPSLLVYGQMSHCIATSDALLALIPDSRQAVIRGAGHFFPAVRPRQFVRLLVRFLDRHDLSRTASESRLGSFARRGMQHPRI